MEEGVHEGASHTNRQQNLGAPLGSHSLRSRTSPWRSKLGCDRWAGKMAPATSKYKTVMGTVFRFGQAEGLLPLGEAYNPIGYVTGIPATSDYEAVVLTPEQALNVLDQLQQPEYAMIVLVTVTGICSDEMLGLGWRDDMWDRSEMKIKQTFVHGKIQQGAKTKFSKSTVALHPILPELLKD